MQFHEAQILSYHQDNEIVAKSYYDMEFFVLIARSAFNIDQINVFFVI